MFTLPETFTVWNATKNAFGESTWLRFEIIGRHAQKQETFTDKNGDQTLSQAVCYSEDENLKLDSFIVFEIDPSLIPPEHAFDVKALSATPSATPLKKAWF